MSAALLKLPGRPALSFELHRPSGAVKGAVLLTHGYAEHSGRYGEVIDALLSRGLLTATWDLRGHGHSEGHRGYVERFDEYLDDADALLDRLAQEDAWSAAGKPVLMGHSLGGLVTFLVAARHPERFAGVVLSAPFFGLALAVPAPKRLAGQFLSRVLPKLGLPSGLKGSDLTHDAAKVTAYDRDPLHFDNVPARWFTEALAAQERALSLAPSFQLPILLLAPGEDRVASTPASRKLFEAIGSRDKELRVLDGQFHEIFNELERPRFIAMATDRALAMATT